VGGIIVLVVGEIGGTELLDSTRRVPVSGWRDTINATSALIAVAAAAAAVVVVVVAKQSKAVSIAMVARIGSLQ